MINVQSFGDIVDRYKVIFFDAFGVLKNYKGLVPGIEKTFEYLNKHKKQYYIVTNDASRSPALLASKYNEAGLSAVTKDRIISSGMLVKEYLSLKVNSGIVGYLGTELSAHYIQNEGLDVIPVKDVNVHNMEYVNALVFLDDEGFDWRADLNKTINILRKRPIPTIVANTDDAYPLNMGDICIAAGGLAAMVEKVVGKKFIKFGKPDSQMYMFAYEKITRNMHVKKSEILMVGDTLATDILGGNKFGLDTALVLSGNTLATDVESRITSSGILPTYVCPSAVIDL